MIRTAVIGLNETGRRYADACRKDPLSELVGVCGKDHHRVEAIGREIGVQAFADASALFAGAQPQVCVVCEPDQGGRITGDLLNRGVHILSCLPISRSGTATPGEATASRKGFLAAGFHLRFNPAMDKAREWISAGEIGVPLFVNVNLWGDRQDTSAPDALFNNLGTHGIDLCMQFAGDIRRVQCFAVSDAEGAWSSAQINLACADGTVGHLTISDRMASHHPIARCEIAGSRARIVIENVYEDTTLFVHERPEKLVLTNSIFGGMTQLSEAYERRLHAFLECAEKRDFASDTTAADAFAVARVVEAALRSAENGSVEEVEV